MTHTPKANRRERTTETITRCIVATLVHANFPVMLIKLNGSRVGMEVSQIADIPHSEYPRWRISKDTLFSIMVDLQAERKAKKIAERKTNDEKQRTAFWSALQGQNARISCTNGWQTETDSDPMTPSEAAELIHPYSDYFRRGLEQSLCDAE